ncbi:putative membrane protein YphA (DoxX/SURF4 family) [Anseongella ginsenosidimutans]|uniref:Putative membrane protein YphA (DoxX/SURF4 family) n=1 Tax=Anseongella ginsenosidimutans TaxID=496056 RepID=A0A4V2UTX1_9SPHI|nr:DoxX family protein [Anseongella ginsenosidimutans]QEC53272.1 DoxX family protein [Anseongella ginsenosidimutans]TCS88142.1 putative membrane protein YphA (DoxX/SURF4 family) [Anseongella ginsenosidimutans]
MNMIHKLELWGDTHHPVWLDFVRIFLGVIILMKGIYFLNNSDAVQAVMESRFGFMGWMSIHYVAFAHLVGGVLIFFGLLTRLAAAVQIPILIGAVFFVNITRGLSAVNSELWLSILVLLLLILFLVAGSGPLSLDQWFKTHKDR